MAQKVKVGDALVDQRS